MPRIPNANRMGWSNFKTDMFGRSKVSNPVTLFDSSHRYQRSQDYDEETSGTASVTHLPNESSLSLAIGTSSGDILSLESRKVFPYQPGKALQVMQTFVMAPAQEGLRQRVGYFSRQNGFYLEQSGTDVSFVIRSYASGAVVENRVAQADWNIDPLDGTGPTDIVLDLTKAQILISEYEWLGVGSVRVGFMIDGVFVNAHQFNHANNVTAVYMTTATLPLRYEIENLAATDAASAMKQICSTVVSNGGYTQATENWSASRTTTVNISTSFYPVVAIRLNAGRTDSVIIPTDISILGIAQGNYEYALIRNPTTLTGGTWVDHAPLNNVEYNISATAMTGGTKVFDGLFTSSKQGAGDVTFTTSNLPRFDLQLGRTNADSPVSDVYVLAARSLGGTQSVVGSLSWADLL